jgi:4'-phosphopantetheinyl transferase
MSREFDRQTWQSPTDDWSLPTGAIHVWRINLTAVPTDQITLLSDDEQARSARFHKPTDRAAFVAARSTLRRLLGHYLNQAPKTLMFRYGPQGKPAMDGLEFNLSHTAGWALVAVSADRAVGIDLEALRPVPELARLTARFFSPSEHRAIAQLPPEQREPAFFRYWTCKEAYLKGTGTGLGQIQTAEIQFAPAQLVNPGLQPWTLFELAPGPGLVGALAAPGNDWQPHLWDWPPGMQQFQIQ